MTEEGAYDRARGDSTTAQRHKRPKRGSVIAMAKQRSQHAHGALTLAAAYTCDSHMHAEQIAGQYLPIYTRLCIPHGPFCYHLTSFINPFSASSSGMQQLLEPAVFCLVLLHLSLIHI